MADDNYTTVAEFAYDALGRRIKKVDSKASETTLYYHNTNWQVLAETNSGGTTQRWFIYGNYIDEPLRMTDAGSGDSYYYVHDHLYSPVALVDEDGEVVERYEYDAYGNCHIYSATYTPRSSSLYDNPYLFTGRRVDMLDSGGLKLQGNRRRYYNQPTGRWYTPDPLGIVPNAQAPNVFDPERQYADGGNLYEYARSSPVNKLDADGLNTSEELSDFDYFWAFAEHRYYGKGALWTKGSSNLRRQYSVKLPAHTVLSSFAWEVCDKLPQNGSCEKTGVIVRKIDNATADDNIYMRLTLGTAEAFIVIGSYDVYKREVWGDDCFCAVNYSNRFIWWDTGDLDLTQFSDRLLYMAEAIGFLPLAITGGTPRDFPINIGWNDECSYSYYKSKYMSIANRVGVGWPAELQMGW